MRMSRAARALLAACVASGIALGAPANRVAAEPDPVDETVHADFNGDGYDDLAVGVPVFDVGSKVNAGAVSIVYGSEQGPGEPSYSPGPRPTNSQLITQDTASVADAGEAGDQFGSAVLAGRFNGDSYVDIAIGVPFEDVGGVIDAGAVHVLYGSPNGLTAAASGFFTQNSTGVPGASEFGDRFGSSFAAADFGHSAVVDLAVGAPYEDAGTKSDVGTVHVFYGSSGGITGSGSAVFSQDTAGVAGSTESGDRFGAALAAGNFGRSGVADLAIGVPMEDLTGSDVDAGLVQVLYGSSTGLTGTASAAFSQDTAGVASSAEGGDRFGASLAAGNFGKSAHADLAVTAPTEDLLGDDIDVGVLHVLYGSTMGIVTTGSQYISQDSGRLPGNTEQGDQFGSSLVVGQFGRSAHLDLAIGVPREDLATLGAPPTDPQTSNLDAGGVYVLYGSAAGVDTTGITNRNETVFFSQDTLSAPSTSESHDRFATSLAAGNFGGTGFDDLAVGVPFEDLEGTLVADAGAVNLWFGSSSGTMAEKAPQYLTRQNAGLGVGRADERFGYTLGALAGS